MRRFLIPLVVAGGLVASSCGTLNSGDLATVNGVAIPREEVIDETQFELLGLDYDTEPTIGDTAVSLSFTMLEQFVDHLLEDNDLEVTDELRNQVATQQGIDLSAVPPEDKDLIDAQVEVMAKQTLFAQNAQQLLTDELLEDYIATLEEDQLERYCVSVIEVADEATGEDILGRLEAGESFADILVELSAQATNPAATAGGGALGCGDAASIETSLGAEASATVLGLSPGEHTGLMAVEVADPSGQPVEAMVILSLDEVTELDTELLRAEIEAGNLDALTVALTVSAAEADITVDKTIGEWDPSILQVVPPEGPLPAPGTTPLDPLGSG